jgi:hypothetical protein
MLVMPRHALSAPIDDLKDKNYGSTNIYEPFDS